MTPILTSTQSEPQWVVIISDDAHFGRDLIERWQTERFVPEFTSMTSELWQRAAVIWEDAPIELDPAPIHDYDYDLAIIGAVSAEQFASTLELVPPGTPVVALLPTEVSPSQIRSKFPNVLPLRQGDGAMEAAVMAGSELLQRSSYQKRLVEAESSNRNSRSLAALGKYMLESRHSFNNALTSVLGTAELLQLSGLQPAAEARDQVKTIHLMALRLQSLMQRFSAVEAETKMGERQSRERSEVLPFQRRRTETPKEVRP